MRNVAILSLIVLGLSACATGYVPPVSTAAGPPTAPSVAADSTWEKQPVKSYMSEQGHTLAVYTNSAVGGTMFFEVVPTDGQAAVSFADASCANAADRDGVECGAVLGGFDEGYAKAFFYSPRARKYGIIVVQDALGGGNRALVCTGSWSLYGQPAEREEQKEIFEAQLHRLCKSYALR